MTQDVDKNELRSLSRELKQERAARKAAEAENEAKSGMVATVSHELRTPISAIISMADLLQTTPLDPTQRQYCHTLQNSARGLLTVLNDILDMSKIHADRLELNPEDISLKAFFGDIETMLLAKAREKKLKTGLSAEGALDQWVKLDQFRLRQVITNLIENAVKFTDQGAVTVSVALDRQSRQEFCLKVEVADTGPGFDAATREKLFQPFVQADSTVAASHGGSGLGLAIARDLIALMGGSIDCAGRPGKGARFWFEIPCAAGEPAKGHNGHADGGQHASALEPARVQHHVLVVEDNKINRTLIGVFLEKFGMSYQMSARGEEALELVRKENFDAVLMDVRMRGMDGIATTEKIRALGGACGDVPIIALTAYAMDGDMDRFLAAGMNGYVSKPIDPGDLLNAIETAIESRGAAQAATSSTA